VILFTDLLLRCLFITDCICCLHAHGYLLVQLQRYGYLRLPTRSLPGPRYVYVPDSGYVAVRSFTPTVAVPLRSHTIYHTTTTCLPHCYTSNVWKKRRKEGSRLPLYRFWRVPRHGYPFGVVRVYPPSTHAVSWMRSVLVWSEQRFCPHYRLHYLTLVYGYGYRSGGIRNFRLLFSYYTCFLRSVRYTFPFPHVVAVVQFRRYGSQIFTLVKKRLCHIVASPQRLFSILTVQHYLPTRCITHMPYIFIPSSPLPYIYLHTHTHTFI